MSEHTANHPQPEALIDFGLGKLDAEKSSAIEEHLSECEDCCETLLNLQDDTFTGLVRSLPKPSAQTSHDVTEGAVEREESGHAPTMLVSSDESDEISELPPELKNHPRYRIVEQIGKGGMGDVFRAEHKLMNRSVALKVINSQLVKHPHAVERFRREVQAAARLAHPNIVTAFDAEQAGDSHFLVMEFVKGRELASLVKERGPLSVSDASDCIRQAAEGLQHAYEHGMVHRDIKPHNLMLSPNGQVRILDFGLAGFASETALIESESNDDTSAQHLTTFGSVMGTPDYIAPEQARDAHSADIRADIYSLGCTLYFLLTGKPPHSADSVADKLKAHAELEPADIRAVRVDVPDELADVIRRMLAKDPAQRFQTPAEVANALAPFVDQHATVQSGGSSDRPPRRAGLRGTFAAAAVILAGVIFVVSDRGQIEITTSVDDVEVVVTHGGKEITTIDLQTGSKVTWLPSGEYRLQLKQDRNDVELLPRQIKLSRWGKEIVTVKHIPQKEQVAETDRDRIQGTWIAESGVRNGQPTPPEEIGLLRAVFNGDRLQVVMPRGIEGDGHFQLTETTSPKQIGVFVAGENKGMRGIYKLEGDRLTLCMNQDPAGAFPTTFAAPEGTEFDLIVMRRTALPKSDLPRQIAGHEASVRSLSFSPDGTRLLSSSDKGMLRLHDVATGRQLREFSGHSRSIRSVSFSADGTRVLSSGWDNTIRLWDVATGEAIRAIEDGNGLLHSSLLNAEGNRIISCSHVGQSEGAIRVWDVKTGELLKEFEGVTFQPFEVVLSPAGDRALSGGHDAVMRLWDVETGKVIREFRGHSDWVRTAAFSKDGKRAVSGSKDNSIRVWNVETGELLRTLTGHTNLVESAVFTPDGRRVLSASMDGSVRLWDVSTGEELAGFGSPVVVNGVAISPDGLTAASGGDDKLIRVWRMAELYSIEGESVPDTKSEDADAKNAAIEAAQKWFELLDAGEYGKCWDEMASVAKEKFNREEFITALERGLKPQGKVLSRSLPSVRNDRLDRLHRTPKSPMNLTYKTRFENRGEQPERLNVLMIFDSDGQWRVGAFGLLPLRVLEKSDRKPGE